MRKLSAARAAVLGAVALVMAVPVAAKRSDTSSAAGPAELVVAPGALVDATVEGKPVTLAILSGGPDRLILNAASADRIGLKPALFVGRASLNVAGRREFEGKNRPAAFAVGGVAQKGRALWFPQAPPKPGDGSIGPWGLAQPRVTFTFGDAGDAGEQQRNDFPLFGNVNNYSLTVYRDAAFGTVVEFDLDSASLYPIASAAAGGAIAAAYGGALSGPSWDVEILFGIKRPVRLLTLDRPFRIGPLSFTKIAVRVRDRIDAGGLGAAITDADTVEDPAEIIVSAKVKGPPPVFTFRIPRAGMAACTRLSFDKAARRIELWCRPGS